MGGKFHLKLNIDRETDSEQVPWGKDEKNFEKRVKQYVKLLKGKRTESDCFDRSYWCLCPVCECLWAFTLNKQSPGYASVDGRRRFLSLRGILGMVTYFPLGRFVLPLYYREWLRPRTAAPRLGNLSRCVLIWKRLLDICTDFQSLFLPVEPLLRCCPRCALDRST